MSVNIVGEIQDIRGLTSLEWKIYDYFSLLQKADTFYESPPFPLSDATWCIRIYPNGQRRNNTVEWIGLFLLKKESRSVCHNVTMKLGITYGNQRMYKYVTGDYNFIGNTHTFGSSKLVERLQLFRDKKKIAPTNVLTISCTASLCSSFTSTACQTISVDSTDVLCHDFEELFLTGRNADVTITVGGQKFRAHKLILETRSPVFSAMFNHNMKEKCSSSVSITDCDATTFEDFLFFLYTGRTEKLLPDKAIPLYSLADKYDIPDLREKCLSFLRNALTLDVACDVLAVADRHHEEQLRNSAKELLVKNMKTVLPSQQWKSFMTENPSLAVEILMTIVPDNK